MQCKQNFSGKFQRCRTIGCNRILVTNRLFGLKMRRTFILRISPLKLRQTVSRVLHSIQSTRRS